ncbi:hypothetical protein [Salinarchaeum laminariae]|uniref:hypothetical protein n=1 Tax=Salinarchaeum laminariae TaxID=869888 RepID=UPI0020C159F6|nr:hypothetical protein [Salinarchaeum laminariae]
MNRILLVVGFALVATGLAFGAAHTGAFDRASADRDVSVSVAADSESYLATEVTYDGSEVSNYFCIWIFCGQVDQSQEVTNVQNRYNGSFSSVTFEVANIQGTADGTLDVSEDPAQLDPSQADTVVLACSDNATASGTGDVTLRAEASGSIEVYDGSIVVPDVQYDCDASY